MASALIHEILPVGFLQCNCMILGDAGTREAIVIDPGDEIERVLEILTRHKLKVRAILSTHAHIDHVGGLAKLHEITGAPILMHAEDVPLYQAMERQAAWLGMPAPPVAAVDSFLREGDTVRWGGYEAQILHTPGHTPGSVSLYLPRTGGSEEGSKQAGKIIEPGRLLAGDTLFAGSIGRTDLWGGDFDSIMRSIHLKLIPLPEDTVVYPGHGPTTTIGRERATNPFLQ
jgi:hydroxyacylglutathione hydrolase